MLLARRLRSCVTAVLAVLAVMAVPSTALAGIEAGPFELGMYGRMGVAWNPQNGRFVHGKYMNLLGGPIGGRLEEGDYLEPTIKLNVVKASADDATKPYFHVVLTPSMFSNNGSFLGAFANNFSAQLRIELFQAYLEAGNVLIPDLKIWAGQRFYRGSDVHIADYYFFNQLNAQGFGVKYKGFDTAVLLQTGTRQYTSVVSDNNPTTNDPSYQRQRTVFVGQYVLPVAEKHALHFLGELHLLPSNRALIGGEVLQPGDTGTVAGAKFRADLGNGSFYEGALRFGFGIANGAFGGSPTWGTFGNPGENGEFFGNGAWSSETVHHLVYNVNPLFAVNAYAIGQRSQGASGDSTDNAVSFATGARTFLYLHDQFHLINELTWQAVAFGLPPNVETPPLPFAWKFTVMPTIVPSGERSVWARPHLRLIYTLAYYSEGARAAFKANRLNIPYMQDFGARTFGHYLGARAEWWF